MGERKVVGRGGGIFIQRNWRRGSCVVLPRLCRGISLFSEVRQKGVKVLPESKIYVQILMWKVFNV